MLRTVVISLSLVLASGCVDSAEDDFGQDSNDLKKSRDDGPRYTEWKNNGERLFDERTKEPVTVTVGAEDGYVVTFGIDSADGQIKFAVFAEGDRYRDMVEAANREAAGFTMPGTNEGIPAIKIPRPIGPGGGDLIPSEVATAVKTFGIDLGISQKNFFDNLPELDK